MSLLQLYKLPRFYLSGGVQPVVTPLIGGGVFVQTGGLMQCLGGICPSFFGSEEETEPIKPRSPRTRGEVKKASEKAGYDIRDTRIKHMDKNNRLKFESDLARQRQMQKEAAQKTRQRRLKWIR